MPGIRTLVLTGSIGNGHLSVADVYYDALTKAGADVRVRDSLKMLGRKEYIVGVAMYRTTLRYQGLFDAFHFSQMRAGGALARAADRASSRKAGRALRGEMEWLGGGVIFSVFATASAGAAAMRSVHSDVRSVAVVTDATAHALWVHPGTDLYIVGSELTAATVWAHDPYARVAILPSAVKPHFYEAPARASARHMLSIAEDARCVLIMTGGWGIGPLVECASRLADDGLTVIAVAGNNKRAERALRRIAASGPAGSTGGKVIPFGFTNQVPELMAACDIVVTASGQTCNEARVVGRPLLLLDIVPGHGRENMLHEVESGGAQASIADPLVVRDAVNQMFARAPKLPAWPVSSAKEWASLLMDTLGEAGIPIIQNSHG
ncbi:MAG: MGDG synthase family glycosyltransferase [Acidimicrobiales bacterium]